MVNFDIQDLEKIYVLIARIDGVKYAWEFAGKFILPQTIEGFLVGNLLKSAHVSNVLEKGSLTLKEIESAFKNLKSKKFNSEEEGEIAGYIETLEMILRGHNDFVFSEILIRQFHERMLRYSSIDMYRKGQYRFNTANTNQNVMGLFMGRSVAPPAQKDIKDLVENYNSSLEKKENHPLILIAKFIFEYLKISPFRDGNESSSRILTHFLLMKQDYAFASLSTLEYDVYEGGDFTSWVLWFLTCIEKQAQNSLKAGDQNTIEHLLSEKQLQLWQWANNNKSHAFSRKDAVGALGFPERTVEEIIKKLTLMKRFQRVGEGKATRYRVV